MIKRFVVLTAAFCTSLFLLGSVLASSGEVTIGLSYQGSVYHTHKKIVEKEVHLVGTAKPKSEILLIIRQNGSIAERKTLISNIKGDWAYNLVNVQDGDYEVDAQQKNEKGDYTDPVSLIFTIDSRQDPNQEEYTKIVCYVLGIALASGIGVTHYLRSYKKKKKSQKKVKTKKS